MSLPLQANVPTDEVPHVRPEPKGEVHPPVGRRLGGRLPLQVPQQSVDRGWEGGPRDAEEDVHPPGQPGHWGAVDAEGGLLPQAEADQQPVRQARLGGLCKITIT